MKKLIATLMLAFLVSALPAVNAAPLHDELRMRKITGLFELIEERLSLMDEVAAYKFRNKLAIEDLDREAVVLDNAARSALRYGFTPESSRFFFAIQIEAAKEIQRYWFQEWSADRPFPADVPSLSEVVRPRLTRLGDAIVENIAATYPIYDRSLASQFVRSVNVEGLSDGTKYTLFRALFEVERFPNLLDQVTGTGILRIGTTGDYAPFTYTSGTEFSPSGIDIDMADSLARSLGVEIQWVRTSWPELMNDLLAGKFDIAMGGISRTLKRQRQALFSMPYHVGGKMPIGRCSDKARLTSLAQIDQPDIRVIVNPGGTNQKYVQEHIRQAKIRVFDDNRKIFDEILADRADVMITDAVEVSLQTTRHPALCALTSEPLTYQDKAYLMPRDLIWQNYVNTWLEQEIASGRYTKRFEDGLQR